MASSLWIDRTRRAREHARGAPADLDTALPPAAVAAVAAVAVARISDQALDATLRPLEGRPRAAGSIST